MIARYLRGVDEGLALMELLPMSDVNLVILEQMNILYELAEYSQVIRTASRLDHSQMTSKASARVFAMKANCTYRLYLAKKNWPGGNNRQISRNYLFAAYTNADDARRKDPSNPDYEALAKRFAEENSRVSREYSVEFRNGLWVLISVDSEDRRICRQ